MGADRLAGQWPTRASPPATGIGASRFIAAVTLDFWNTLFRERTPDACNELRAERIVPLLADHGARVPAAAARQAVGAAYAAYRARWRLGLPYDARDAVETIVRELGVRLPGEGRRRLQALVEDPGRSHGLLPVVPAADVRDALLDLRHSGVRLGIVSDTGLSPGRTLRAYLRDAGLAWLFEPAGLAFSDEIGSSKR